MGQRRTEVGDSTLGLDKSLSSIKNHDQNPKPNHSPYTTLRDPASLDDIAELESRLNIALPSDYKQFLLSTNGLGPSWGGIILDPPLHAIEDIKWTDEDTFTHDIPLDLLEKEFSINRHQPAIEDWPTVGSAVEIGYEDIEDVWLIPPHAVHRALEAYLRHYEGDATSSGQKKAFEDAVRSFAGSREAFQGLEWCVVTFSSGEMAGYPSFKAFMAGKAWRSRPEVDLEDGMYESKCFAYSCR